MFEEEVKLLFPADVAVQRWRISNLLYIIVVVLLLLIIIIISRSILIIVFIINPFFYLIKYTTVHKIQVFNRRCLAPFYYNLK